MNRLFFIATVLFLSLITSLANAQRTFTLDECLRIAYKQAPQLMEARRTYDIAFSNAEASDRALRSTVDLTLSAPLYNDNTSPIYNPVTGIYDLERQYQVQYGGALTITQPLYWTGGSIAVSGNLFKRQQQPIGGSFENDYIGFAAVQLNQPLFKPNELRMGSREAEIALDLAKANYLTQITALDFNIKNLFYNLYEAEQELKIKKDEVDASQSAYDNGQNKYKAGLIAEVDALQLEADLAAAKTDLFDRERRFQSAQRDLMQALGYPLSESANALLDSIKEINVTVDPQFAIQQALEHRTDVLNAQYDVERQQIAADRVYGQRSVNAAITGVFGATPNAVLLDNLLQNTPLNKSLTFSVNIPIFDWGAHSYRMDAANAAIELSKVSLDVKREQVENEVRTVIEQIESARKQSEVARKSEEVAEKVYDLSRSRFDIGKITSQDLSLAQQRLTQARLSALSAVVAEHLAIADLTQKTLYDFEHHRPVEVPN